ncbi:HIT family protein [Streptococcus ovuberis]|uniref:HIT family protein n=1 Tax=Streptococcus ovuberis TaxID=1936207 RepID=A0A7X6MXX7_9STRE|nr:HIT family protein [Streptococcus ovuberis]NKZ19769.1 HIT family protein [Streptococcus ovuberis]
MCLICDRIEAIQKGENPYFVAELETGYVVIGDHQYFKGYTLFLSKEHVTELHFLEKEVRNQHLIEMADVAEAVARAFDAQKMNIESLGNGDPHLHWHLFPRQEGDLKDYGHNGRGPVWWLPFDEMMSEHQVASGQTLEEMKNRLAHYLEKFK